MKLRKGQARYKLPPFSRVLNVVVEGNHRHNQMYDVLLPIVPFDQARCDEKPAMPRCCVIGPDSIKFAPPPDKPYSVRVRYTPPIMEF